MCCAYSVSLHRYTVVSPMFSPTEVVVFVLATMSIPNSSWRIANQPARPEDLWHFWTTQQRALTRVFEVRGDPMPSDPALVRCIDTTLRAAAAAVETAANQPLAFSSSLQRTRTQQTDNAWEWLDKVEVFCAMWYGKTTTRMRNKTSESDRENQRFHF